MFSTKLRTIAVMEFILGLATVGVTEPPGVKGRVNSSNSNNIINITNQVHSLSSFLSGLCTRRMCTGMVKLVELIGSVNDCSPVFSNCDTSEETWRLLWWLLGGVSSCQLLETICGVCESKFPETKRSVLWVVPGEPLSLVGGGG